MPIKENYIIEKNSFLVEIKSNNMSLQELRFLCIYLSKINARNISTRCVRFSLSDFQKIMNIGRMNIKHFKKAVDGLLCKVVHMPTEDGGLSSFQLFKKVRLFKDDFEKWQIEIDAHDDALPLFFNLKGNYLKYELWNALNLNSVNQLRMYELLKRYEKLCTYEIKVSELREYLCIISNRYAALKDFKKYVLDNCQQALKDNTDICYTYECGKRGSHGKWLTIIFHISKNTPQNAPTHLDDFIDKQPEPQPEDVMQAPEQQPDNNPELPPVIPVASSSALSRQPYLSGEFEEDLAPADIKLLCDMLSVKVPKPSERTPELLEKRLKLLYGQMLVKSKDPVRNPVTYLVGCINRLDPDKLPDISTKDNDFDVSMYSHFVNDFDYSSDPKYDIFINNYETI